jgi:hypothetical protein
MNRWLVKNWHGAACGDQSAGKIGQLVRNRQLVRITQLVRIRQLGGGRGRAAGAKCEKQEVLQTGVYCIGTIVCPP